MGTFPDKMRLDKWLWQARFFKSRTLSARKITAGHIKVNRRKVEKPSCSVSTGDVLTFVQSNRVRIIRIEALGHRRGSVIEAHALFTDLASSKESR